MQDEAPVKKFLQMQLRIKIWAADLKPAALVKISLPWSYRTIIGQ